MLAKRIGALMRLMASDHEGEAIGALRGLRRLLPTERLEFSDVETLIENCDGRIEQVKYSDTEAATFFNSGVEKGKAEAVSRGTILPEDFYHEDGSPRWLEIAVWCQERSARLRPKEQEFIDDMAGRLQWVGRKPTEKQGQWLSSIFFQLGGRRKQ